MSSELSVINWTYGITSETINSDAASPLLMHYECYVYTRLANWIRSVRLSCSSLPFFWVLSLTSAKSLSYTLHRFMAKTKVCWGTKARTEIILPLMVMVGRSISERTRCSKTSWFLILVRVVWSWFLSWTSSIRTLCSVLRNARLTCFLRGAKLSADLLACETIFLLAEKQVIRCSSDCEAWRT